MGVKSLKRGSVVYGGRQLDPGGSWESFVSPSGVLQWPLGATFEQAE